jgi:hypothetical protein
MFIISRCSIGSNISTWINNRLPLCRRKYHCRLHQLKPSYNTKNNVSIRVGRQQKLQQQTRIQNSAAGGRWNTTSSTYSPKSTSTGTTTKKSKLTLEEEARAEKLFADLNEMMLKRQKRMEEEQSKSWFDSIHSFWKSSKHQLINVAAAFGCVIMAIQVTDARIIARKSAAYVKEKEEEVTDLKKNLGYICSEDFAKDTATKYAESLSSMQQHSNTAYNDNGRRRSWLALLTWDAADDDKTHLSNTVVVDTHTLASIIRQEIKDVLGDKHPLTDAERAAIEVKHLQTFIGTGEDLNTNAKELVDAIGEIEETTKEDGATVIKKRKIMF